MPSHFSASQRFVQFRVWHPYKHIVDVVKSMKLREGANFNREFAQCAWNYANDRCGGESVVLPYRVGRKDVSAFALSESAAPECNIRSVSLRRPGRSLRTTLCLQFNSKTIASAAMWLAAKNTKVVVIPAGEDARAVMERTFKEWGCRGNPRDVPGAATNTLYCTLPRARTPGPVLSRVLPQFVVCDALPPLLPAQRSSCRSMSSTSRPARRPRAPPRGARRR